MIQDFLHRMSFGLAARAEVWQLLSDFTATGMELGLALETAAEIYRDRGNRSVQHIVTEMRESLRTGSIRPAMLRYGAESDRLMFSGEGMIEAAAMFGAAARIARGQLSMRRAIRAALTGPTMAMIALLGLYYILGSQMIPAMKKLAPTENWPGYARAIAWIATGISEHILLVVPAAVLLLFLLGASTRYWTGAGRATLDRIPPWSLYRMQTGLMFLLLLVESGRMGRNLNTALLLELARLSGPYVRNRITAIARLSGNSPAGIGAAAKQCGNGWPAPALNAALAAYSRQDNWLENFSTYLDRWMKSANHQAKAAASMVNYALMMLVAASLCGALLTIFGLLGVVQKSF